MSMIERLHRTRSFPTMRVESDPSGSAHWLYMHSDIARGVRPCFRTALMDDMWSFLTSITLREAQRQPGQLRHVVLASDADAFNLGGDLELFSRLIRDGNREQLLAYARRCIDGVYHLHASLGGDVRTIALVQGDALGGGMELALACQTIVAEEGVGMGLPEVLFGLFPGMGAYSFLCKRVPPQLAEKIILEGNVSQQRRTVSTGHRRHPGAEGRRRSRRAGTDPPATARAACPSRAECGACDRAAGGL